MRFTHLVLHTFIKIIDFDNGKCVQLLLFLNKSTIFGESRIKLSRHSKILHFF